MVWLLGRGGVYIVDFHTVNATLHFWRLGVHVCTPRWIGPNSCSRVWSRVSVVCSGSDVSLACITLLCVQSSLTSVSLCIRLHNFLYSFLSSSGVHSDTRIRIDSYLVPIKILRVNEFSYFITFCINSQNWNLVYHFAQTPERRQFNQLEKIPLLLHLCWAGIWFHLQNRGYYGNAVRRI